MTEEPFLNTTQVMEWLSLSRDTIEKLVNSGEFNRYKFGRCCRYNPQEIRDYIERVKCESIKENRAEIGGLRSTITGRKGARSRRRASHGRRNSLEAYLRE